MGLKRKTNEKHDFEKVFPVMANVDCFMSNLEFKRTTSRSLVVVSFKKEEGKYLSHTFWQPLQEEEGLEKNRLLFKSCIESILSVYLSGQEMVTISKMSSGLESYIDNAKEALTLKRYWERPVVIKTFLKKNKEVILVKYPPFIRLKGVGEDFKYNPWEKGFIKEHLYKRKF